MTRHTQTEWERACMTSQLASDRKRVKRLRRDLRVNIVFLAFWVILIPAAVAAGVVLCIR